VKLCSFEYSKRENFLPINFVFKPLWSNFAHWETKNGWYLVLIHYYVYIVTKFGQDCFKTFRYWL